jgi:hypothetical protein
VDSLAQDFFLAAGIGYGSCFESFGSGEVSLPRAITAPTWISSPALKRSVPAPFDPLEPSLRFSHHVPIHFAFPVSDYRSW